MTYFTRELANDQNDTVHYQNLNDTYEYEAPKKFLTEEENTPTINTNSSQFNQKPAFLNSYKFMTNNIITTMASSNINAMNSKDAIINSNMNSTNTSILYSPKVFQHEGTNSRYSSASFFRARLIGGFRNFLLPACLSWSIARRAINIVSMSLTFLNNPIGTPALISI